MFSDPLTTPIFPPEIQSMFILELRGDKISLLSVSQVSHHWREESLDTLFFILDVAAYQAVEEDADLPSSPSKTFTFQYSRFQMWSSFFADRVHHLVLQGPTAEQYSTAADEDVELALPSLDICILRMYMILFQNVSSITLKHLIWEVYPRHLIADCCRDVCRSFSNITLVDIQHRNFAASCAFDTLALATSLDHLQYDLRSALVADIFSLTSSPPSLPRRTAITPINITVESNGTECHSSRSLPTYPSPAKVKTFKMQGISWADLRHFTYSLASQRQSLQYLEISLLGNTDGE